MKSLLSGTKRLAWLLPALVLLTLLVTSSIGAGETDVAVTSISFDPVKHVSGEPVTINISIENNGNVSVNGTLHLFASGKDWEVEINTTNFTGLAPGENRTLSFDWTPNASAKQVKAQATVDGDENTTNDSKEASLSFKKKKEFEITLWRVLGSLVPIIAVFVGILGLKLSSRYVAPTVLVITVLIAFGLFTSYAKDIKGFDPGSLTGYALSYSVLWGILEYVYAILGAFLFLHCLRKTGALDKIKNDFASLSSDKQHQILLIGFAFAMILATVAPAGSNFVIAAIMLIELGFNPVGVGVLCLFGNALSSSYGLLGISFKALEASSGVSPFFASGMYAQMALLFFILAPLWMNMVYTKKGPLRDLKDPDLKEDILLLLIMGGVYGLIQLLLAIFVGPELITLIAGGCTLVAIVIYERKFVHKQPLRIRPIFQRAYFWPFLVMIILLLISSIPTEEMLKNAGLLLEIPFGIAEGGSKALHTLRFGFLTSPGTLLIITSITVPIFVRKREGAIRLVEEVDEETALELKKKGLPVEKKIIEDASPGLVIKKSFGAAGKQVLPIIVSISSFVALANIMKDFGMTFTLGASIVEVVNNSWLYLLVIPWIGLIGSGITGSTSTSNFLFGGLQVDAASRLGIISVAPSMASGGYPEAAGVVAAHEQGSMGGEMISPMNAVVIASAVGMDGREGVLIKRLIPAFIFWMILSMVVTVLFLKIF